MTMREPRGERGKRLTACQRQRSRVARREVFSNARDQFLPLFFLR